jgi:hypothetical protein
MAYNFGGKSQSQQLTKLPANTEGKGSGVTIDAPVYNHQNPNQNHLNPKNNQPIQILKEMYLSIKLFIVEPNLIG